MADTRYCPECGSPIAESGPVGGLCPRCLIGQGLNSRSATQTGGGAGRFDPPDPAELDGRFPQLEILELIGQGGMGAVYKARQPALDRIVALKILAPDRVGDPAFAERFGREARTLARLTHPNIVGIHDFGEVEGAYYLIMEYVDGASLRELMLAGRLSPADALALVPQLCDALQFAHESGVVHRDIKPENILLDRNGGVKIADFGLAKLLEPERADGVSLTASGAVMGTPAYMAPEQIEHPLDVDHRADIYAVGVVFYEMLTGELPLGRFDPPSHKVGLDIRLDGVVLRALEKEPTRRYQFAGEVKADLEHLDRGEPAPPPEPAAQPAAQSATAPPGTRTVTITRPPAVSWIAAYSFVMAALLPAALGVALVWFLLGARGVSVSAGIPEVHTPIMRSTPLMVATFAGPLCLVLGVWHLLSGLGAVKLRNWSRYSLIILALFEAPWPLLAPFVGFSLVLVPVTIASFLILVYLFMPPTARIFRHGLGPVTLPAAEADELERAVRGRSWG
jgi:tRNA A-37 threonylcarbamoyl transferase component Bud32